MSKEQRNVLIIVAICTLLTLIASTYSYFKAKAVEGNSETNTVVLLTQDNGELTVQFDPNFNKINSTFVDLPEEEAGTDYYYILKFSVNSTSNVAQSIQVKWKDLVNTYCQYRDSNYDCSNLDTDTYVADEISYALFSCTSSQYNSITSVDDTDVNSCNKVSATTDEPVPTTGTVSRLNRELISVPANSTNYYVVRIKLKNLVTDQSYQQGKSFNGTINIDYFDVYSYDYTGTEQIFIAPKTGIYKIELWGAQGGYSYIEDDINYRGGYGSYSVGMLSLEKDETLYVYVGGMGKRCICHTAKTCCGENGGYNGGGKTYQYTGSSTYYGSGGGATHIAFTSGLLKDLVTAPENVLIVAGGGGGASNWQGTAIEGYNFIGGNGGGSIGMMGSYSRTDRTNTCTGGSQTMAGTGTSNVGSAFGIGAYAGTLYGPGGGGGYYGGGTSETYSCGGSGYIDNVESLLGVTKMMYCHECTQINQTISTEFASNTPTSEYAKSGNGYARITFQS